MDFLADLGAAFFGALYEYRIPIAIGSVIGAVAVAFVALRRGWVDAARRHPGRSAAVILPALAIALPVAWYMASPLFISTRVDEPAPVAVNRPTPSPAASADPMSPPPSVALGDPSPTSPPAPSPEPIELAGEFNGSDEFHFGRGTARLIETSPGTWVVRLEDFAVRNGPDLFVYISPSADGYADGAFEVGRLKADTGNQNYEVPAGALSDPATARSVIIWCKQFSHLFATAPLAPV